MLNRIKMRLISLIRGLFLQSHIEGSILKLRLYPDMHILLRKNTKIILRESLKLNANQLIRYGRSGILRMDENASLVTNGNFSFAYGCDIFIMEGGRLELGNSYINADCKVRCSKYIRIGDGCAIARNVTIMDSDVHYIDGEKHIKDVIIGNHVWIGSGATILKGVTIGDGAVVAACSVVTKDVRPGTLVAGQPAKVIRERVQWEK